MSHGDGRRGYFRRWRSCTRIKLVFGKGVRLRKVEEEGTSHAINPHREYRAHQPREEEDKPKEENKESRKW